ncbi:MAG: hypothetical protein JWQ36_188 [Enterovirga sp.]|nr:hypothetical protein [Enterovirga sp.]
MAIIRKTLSDVTASPYQFSPDERARLDALSDDDIERLAREDADNLPLTEQELSRMAAARTVRRVQEGLGLTRPR